MMVKSELFLTELDNSHYSKILTLNFVFSPVFSTFSLTTSHTVPDELISFIRLFLLSPTDYAKQVTKERMPRAKLESESAKIALKLLAKRMEDYDTTIQVRFLFLTSFFRYFC